MCECIALPRSTHIVEATSFVSCGSATEVGVSSVPAYVLELGVINFRTSAASLTLLVFIVSQKGQHKQLYLLSAKSQAQASQCALFELQRG